MEKIGFCTAVSCADTNSLTLFYIIEKIDSYFCLGNTTRARIIPGYTKGNSEAVQLYEAESPLFVTALKVASYFTIILPVILLVAKLILRSCYDFYVLDMKKNIVQEENPDPSRINLSGLILAKNTSKDCLEQQLSIHIQTPDSRTVHAYSGDLTDLEKSGLDTFIDETRCKITFKEYPTIDFSIRKQNMFLSQAQVIVNAANTHLGGGGGIDGAIHTAGGCEYAEAHRNLKEHYNSQFISGHAAMIESGLLKKKHNIENVIVVAGPQGPTTSQKENELYSCYFNSLILAHSQNKTSIAFPSISTGIFRYPKDRAASISLKAIQDFINQYPNTLLKTISIHFLPNESNSGLEIYKAAAL